MLDIRRLTTLDEDVLKRLIVGYVSHQKYRVNRVETDTALSFTLELVRLDTLYVKRYPELDSETLESYRAMLQAGHSFGAYAEDELVGIALAELHTWNRSLWVQELHVAESHRGKGIGRALMEALIEQAKALDCRVIVCETQNTNVPAIRFYQRMGFVIDGVDVSYYSNDDYPDGEIAVFLKRYL
jgi:ribosomal protein S18 acetylase RimI-like enzyme